MAQLSPNTIVYDQIIQKVSTFLSEYRENKYTDNAEILQEYQNIINYLNNNISNPLSVFDPFIKGEPPVSEKFNKFTRNFANDLNIIAKHIDYLSAGAIKAFNLFTSEIEQENKFTNRIKSKIKVLQMYSSSPANDLYYVGNSFDSSDYIDYNLIENKDNIPLIRNGEMTLNVTNSKIWNATSITVDPQSNGIPGNNHAVYSTSDVDNTVRYFFKDSPTSRNLNNIIDNNPLTFYEYEQINVLRKPENAKDFEFEYLGTQDNSKYIWSSFSQDPLKLVLVLENQYPEYANFVNIVPYFGSNNYISKDIVVKEIEIIDKNDVVTKVLNGKEIYISSSLIPNSLDKSTNFFYREANIKFDQKIVKRIKIYLEQVDYTDTKIQHVYFKPVNNSSSKNPYINQNRFDPMSPSVTAADLTYPDISWDPNKISFNSKQFVPSIDQPNFFKSEVSNTVGPVDISLSRQIPLKTGNSVRVKLINGSYAYITGRFFQNFDTNTLINYSNISLTNVDYLPSQYITSSALLSTGGYANPFISQLSDSDPILDQIVTWFNSTTSDGTKSEKYSKFGLDPAFAAEKIEVRSSDLSNQNKRYLVSLLRQYEILDAQRRSISIRDITVGLEEYSPKSQMISRSFDFSSDIEYITMSVDSSFSGQIEANTSDYIKYYISIDGGSKWIQLSAIEDEFKGIPEVLSFNQNIDEKFKIPGVEYFNAPAIPSSVKSVLVKIEMLKPNGQNITPIVYSYKVGAKVKQL